MCCISEPCAAYHHIQHGLHLVMSNVTCLLFPEVTLSEAIPAFTIWCYLCTHLDLPRLCHWVRTQYPEEEDPGKTKLDLVSGCGWPYNQPITVTMLQYMVNCTHYVREAVTVELARLVFIRSCINNIYLNK